MPASAQEPPDSVQPDSVLVLSDLTISIGRLRVGAVPAARTPFPVHTLRVDGGSTESVTRRLAGLPGVTLSNQTGSPYQSDLRLRGFALSPIVGVPQGVSVFVDGVRVNEADASQVHLSLIPGGAVDRVELLRGPVGAFGKNALGGALNFVTARGGEDTSVSVEAEGGSYGSVAGTVRAGGRRDAYDGFFVASYGRSNGWRELGHSQELSVFGKIGWRGERTDAWVSYTFESDSLEGPGPLPESWIQGGPLPADIVAPPKDRRRLQYTGGTGDAFTARLHFLNGRLERVLSEQWSVQLITFARFVDFRQSNDNVTEPNALGITQIASAGTTAQFTYQPRDEFLLILGAEGVRNDVRIEIQAHPNRTFVTLAPHTTERLRTDEDNFASFAESWWALSPSIALHGSLRFDFSSLPVTDLLDPADSGKNTFSELSGGLGLSADLGSGFNAFAGYGRGFRSPVILEVSCADPEDPCQLPFELGPDPPLLPVTSDTWQAGLRVGRQRFRGEAVGYWSEVENDIFNVVDLETPTRGFFTNLERTRRLGLELSAEAVPLRGQRELTVTGSLGWTRATFESSAVLAAPFLDEDDDEGGDPPVVEPGDRFPMVPEFSVSAGVAYAFANTSLALQARWVGEQFLIGDEGNDAPFRKLDRYSLVDLRVERWLGRATAYLELSNLFDRRYSPFGIISRNVRDAEQVERFLTPGLPRALRVGLRVQSGR
ncbi:MAG: TonB-dependent receptor [Gemmatimonadetes bacterium]|nr:TonB-dependent receptor [Gemmatimonadota bacterium]